MACSPLRPCRHPGCPALTRDGFCPKHKPKHRRKESADYHSWYNLPIWTEDLRPRHLTEEPFCRECVRIGNRTRAAVVDHIVPHRGQWELFTDRTNLQSLCKYHHDIKTMRERNERTG